MDGAPTRSDVFFAFLAYFPVLNLVPFFFVFTKRTKKRFVVYHTLQGLYLFSAWFFLQIVLLGLFILFSQIWSVSLFKLVLAVLVTMVFVGYCLLLLLMVGSVLLKRMVMLPVLGELAGER